jgi:nitroreductase
MGMHADSWFNAIYIRHSQRKYSGERPEDSVTDKLDTVCMKFQPFRGARAILVREPGDGVFRGIIGSYFKVTDAPYYVAFIGDTKEPTVQEVVGYLGEGVILEATALGFNTCWVGGFFRPDVVAKQIDLKDNEQVLAISPIGYSKDEADRVGVSAKTHRRKDLSSLVLSGGMDQNSWSKTAIEAARLAPSAVNRQPWRFKIAENAISINTDGARVGFGISRRLDCGIAMLHIELGARSCGTEGKWEFLKDPEVARFTVDQ